jgi:hypothetical protein
MAAAYSLRGPPTVGSQWAGFPAYRGAAAGPGGAVVPLAAYNATAADNQGAPNANGGFRPAAGAWADINSNRQVREWARMANARYQGPTQVPTAGSFPDELLHAVKNKGAGKYTRNLAKRNGHQIEQILGIRKVHDPDDRAVMNEHPFQFATGNKKMLGILKRIKQLTRETQTRMSFIHDIEAANLRDAHPTFFSFTGDEGKLRYNGPVQMLRVPAVAGGRANFDYLFKPGDTFTPIRGGLYNSKAMKEFQALERLQLKREQMQEQFENGFK